MIFLLFITGCSYKNNVPKFPDLPENLKTPCQQLVLIKPTETKFSEMLNTVVTNYGYHNVCSAKVDAYILWHSQQKKIFESIK